tara:strand:- start:445 stop:990 length:546 start_codon:yes stop_codon:yes gene_type:complete
MKFVLPILFLFLSIATLPNTALASEEKCTVKNATQYNENHPLCFFLTGTRHFRNEEYLEAGEKWKEILKMSPFPDEFIDLLLKANNNLGYLYNQGLGYERDSKLALEYWEKAILLGSQETEYHLCYALADEDNIIFFPERAILHCEKAYRIYNGIENKEKSDLEILDMVNETISKLNSIEP